MYRACLLFVATIMLCGMSFSVCDAQTNAQTNAESDRQANRGERLANYLNGTKFVGKFTVDDEDLLSPKTEEYTISKCEKLAAADMYRLTARIKYGDVDSEVPLELKIVWAGSTPVITMDSFLIPAMGTFSARVMIHQGRYAGTWQHDEKGGHMFGKIQKLDAPRDEDAP